ncbi:MAG: PIN domain-containing protein [Chloroflexi bacterium]|nr:PIN domain-containing protein [Chloroflexota bacterium]
MTEESILDTGPLVAFLAANEEHHEWAVERFKVLAPKFLTCEPVLTEACFLVGFAPKAMEQVERFLEQGWIQVPFRFSTERQAVMRLMRAYQNVPMSFADACLVRMSELHEGAPVFTLDTDFRVYRKYGRDAIPTILP